MIDDLASRRPYSKMVHYSAVLASNKSYNPSYRPTALFVGGTSGIGEGAATALAKATKGSFRKSLP